LFVPFTPATRVCVAVVGLGLTDRLRRCLDSLVGHDSEHDFAIVCVVNPTTRSDSDEPLGLPAGIEVIRPELNLGWAGGLHAARALTTGDYLVWVQEDMVVVPGWLDALVEAADARPTGGAFGSVCESDSGEVVLYNAGRAEPADAVQLWNLTDTSAESPPSEPTSFDWLISRGMLVRLAAWDELGGPDPRLYPLNHVDKDFGTHLRAHGWENFTVPRARHRHEGSMSSPSYFRYFVAPWQEDDFNARWSGVVRAMAVRPRPIDHECSPWRGNPFSEIERLVGREASRMLVPVARQLTEWHRRDERELRAQLDAMLASRSWRMTAPLRAVMARLHKHSLTSQEKGPR
jgi:GT2 family glycosyltransferase